MATLQLQMSENLFVRDPQETELGRKIIHHGIKLIDELGIEGFNFKRLAEAIDSTEASVYRYLKISINFWFTLLLGIGIGWNTVLIFIPKTCKTQRRS